MRATAPYRFFDLLQQSTADPAVELRAGLTAAAAHISPKVFYDELRARLFEAICSLPEYPLPLDERSIFERRTGEISAIVGTGCTLIDLGAGNCAKAERLFTALRPAQYGAVG